VTVLINRRIENIVIYMIFCSVVPSLSYEYPRLGRYSKLSKYSPTW